MMYCPKCGEEYRDEISLCVECDCALCSEPTEKYIENNPTEELVPDIADIFDKCLLYTCLAVFVGIIGIYIIINNIDIDYGPMPIIWPFYIYSIMAFFSICCLVGNSIKSKINPVVPILNYLWLSFLITVFLNFFMCLIIVWLFP